MSSLEGILQTLCGVIVAQSVAAGLEAHEPTPTEYFAAVVATLASGKTESNAILPLLRVLQGVLPSASVAVVRSQFRVLSSLLLQVAKTNGDNASVLSTSLACLGRLLLTQEVTRGVWSDVQTLQAFNALLAFIDDESVRVRRVAVESVVSLMAAHAKVGGANGLTLRSYVSEFCVGVLRGATASSYRRALCVVLLLEEALVYIPEAALSNVLAAALSVQATGVTRLCAAVYRTLDSTFQHTAAMGGSLAASEFSVRALTPVVTTLVGAMPTTADVETHCHYYSALASTVALLVTRGSEGIALAHKILPRLLSALCSGCESEFTQVHATVVSSFKRVLISVMQRALCLGEAEKWYATSILPQGESAVEYAANHVRGLTTSVDINISVKSVAELVLAAEKLLALKYQHCWLFLVDAIRSLAEQFRGFGCAVVFLRRLTNKLSDVLGAVDNGSVTLLQGSLRQTLLDAVSGVLQAVGVPIFVNWVPPFDIVEGATAGGVSGDGKGVISACGITVVSREWVIELLTNELKTLPSRLSDFIQVLLPFAGRLHKVSTQWSSLSQSQATQTAVRLLRNHTLQVWSWLPEVSTGRILDFQQSFGSLESILKPAFGNEFYPELAFVAVLTLNRLASAERLRNPTEKQLLGGSAPLYVPLLLNYLETLDLSDGRFKETLTALAAWFQVTGEDLLQTISKRLIQMVLKSTVAGGGGGLHAQDAAVYMAILLAMVPVLPASLASILYRTVRPLLAEESNGGSAGALQKRAYSLLLALVNHHGESLFKEEPRSAMLSLLSESLLTAHVSTRHLRLRVVEALIRGMDSSTDEVLTALNSILGELLLCQKDSNKKTRDAAFECLKAFSQRLPGPVILPALASALAAETTTMRSAAVHAMCLVLLQHYRAHNGATVGADLDEPADLSDGGEDDDYVPVPSTPVYSADSYMSLMNMAVQLLPPLCQLLTQECNDQAKAVLHYLKTVTTILRREELAPVLAPIITAFTVTNSALKHKYVTLNRGIVRKLLRKFSDEEVRSLLPAADHALLDYLARQARKAARKKGRKTEGVSDYDRLLLSDSEDDVDDAMTVVGDVPAGGPGQRPRTLAAKSQYAMSVYGGNDRMDESDGEGPEDYRMGRGNFKATRARDLLRATATNQASDLLDEDAPQLLAAAAVRAASKVTKKGSQKSVRFANSVTAGVSMDSLQSSAKAEARAAAAEDDGMDVVVTRDGRVVVESRADGASGLLDGGKKSLGAPTARGPGSVAPSVARAAKKTAKTTAGAFSHLKTPGLEYRAKKAGGDVWKKSQTLQPHAYIPLDPRLLSKKHRSKAVEHFGSVVAARKKKRG